MSIDPGRHGCAAALFLSALAACTREAAPAVSPAGDDGTDAATRPPTDAADPDAITPAAAPCPGHDQTLTLPPGFCATVYADGVGRAQQMLVTPAGDLYVAVADTADGTPGGVLALRDTDYDGVADERKAFGSGGGHGLAWKAGTLYFARDDRVVSWELSNLPDGEYAPHGLPTTILMDLPADGDHPGKTLAFDAQGRLLVTIGSATNSCQAANRMPGSPGLDPCPELDGRAGVWRFDPYDEGQLQTDGERIATGLRHTSALAVAPESGAIVGISRARDQLSECWPLVYGPGDVAHLPSDELVIVQEGGDYGWPYCHHDPARGQMVLAPEYGGDGEAVGRCAGVLGPQLALPADGAPQAMLFYSGGQFPERYRHGAFVSFHGTSAEPEGTAAPGYAVGFVPFEDDLPRADWEIFASGFAGAGRPLPEAARHRPTGLAEGIDGSLFVADDQRGRIWRVSYVGQE